MLGAIIGDLAGSVFEYDQFCKFNPNKVEIDSHSLISKNAFFSDDTILTVAVADAILSGSDYESKLKEYAKKFMHKIPNNLPYFENMFSPQFSQWVFGDFIGRSEGNGAMMRVSPIGYYFNNEKDVLENARLVTVPSHNSENAIKHAQLVALIIFYAKKGLTKERIIKKLNLKIKKPKITQFNYKCTETIDLCLYSLFNSNSFEEAITKALLFGGDTDTNASIVGAMAEALFGVPNELKHEAFNKLPKDFQEVISKFYLNCHQLICIN